MNTSNCIGRVLSHLRTLLEASEGGPVVGFSVLLRGRVWADVLIISTVVGGKVADDRFSLC